jgi:hypothetical protein
VIYRFRRRRDSLIRGESLAPERARYEATASVVTKVREAGMAHAWIERYLADEARSRHELDQ